MGSTPGERRTEVSKEHSSTVTSLEGWTAGITWSACHFRNASGGVGAMKVEAMHL
jgi:hypothetical protein